MKELICIVCPRGCHLKIDDKLNVTGNFCPRGAKYAISELDCPKRSLTTFIKIKSEIAVTLPVKTSSYIPKTMMNKVMEEINKVTAISPIKIGDIIIKNILDLGVDIVACKSVDK